MAGQILLVAWGVEEKYGRNKTKGRDFMQGFLKRVLAAMLFFLLTMGLDNGCTILD
jgi:membrane-bound lytic murein transglycosylase B